LVLFGVVSVSKDNDNCNSKNKQKQKQKKNHHPTRTCLARRRPRTVLAPPCAPSSTHRPRKVRAPSARRPRAIIRAPSAHRHPRTVRAHNRQQPGLATLDLKIGG
jgi:hypothetical protein